HLADHTLRGMLTAVVAADRHSTAALLADIAEVDERMLFLPAGYSSMYLYCVGELHLSEDAALLRITAARAARRFPAIFGAVARGELHVTGIGRLAPHLTEGNAAELLGAASHRTRLGIEQLLAQRFPQTDMLVWVAGPATGELGPDRVDGTQVVAKSTSDLAQLGPDRVESRDRLTPLSAKSVALQATLSPATSEKLRYAQELLGHSVSEGDMDRLLARVLDLAIPQL